jgi:very-short-patch-repair endonuclease
MKRDSLPTNAIPRARSMRRNATTAESVLWYALREALPQAKFRRQVPIGRYIADFASHRAKLIIEVDGGQHGERIEQDAKRTRFLEGEGFRVIRFWNNDVLTNCDGVLEQIAAALPSPLVGEGAPKGRMRGNYRSRAPA